MVIKRRNVRNLRWNVRVAESEDALVRAACELRGAAFTAFIREAALTEASHVLADRTKFELDPPDWERFTELLERPVGVPGGLRELYSKPSAFE